MDEENEPRRRASGSGIVRVAFRALFVGDPTGTSCQPLARSLGSVVRVVEMDLLGSLAAARAAFAEPEPRALTLVLSCLDLPPAPLAGALAALEADELGFATILVTRSQRWIPPGLERAVELPWVTPEAGPLVLADAIDQALRRSRERRLEAPDGLAWRRAGA